jgi:hypothetical protein
MELKDIQFILNHFEGAGPLFPRTISTYNTRNRQILVTDIDQIYNQFRAADFKDCRINAYPDFTNFQGINMQYPALVMCDLDHCNFKTEKLLQKTLRTTIKNIATDLGESAKPTVLFTGNGYHVYQPIKLPVLERESLFEIFETPSTQFIRYAAKKWTGGKNDPCNHPSVNSCMVRVPNSINSKNGKTVEVVQWWNGVRPAANGMLFWFQVHLVDAKLKYDYKHGRGLAKALAGGKEIRISLIRSDLNSNDAPREMYWIEKAILDGPGIGDWRKATIHLVLAPYLINIRKCDHSTAHDIITDWLDKCMGIRRLDFNARNKIDYALKHAFPYPMRQDTMQSKYPQMYTEIFSRGSSSSSSSISSRMML